MNEKRGVDAQLRNPAQLLVERCQIADRRTRPQQLDRVPIEGDDHTLRGLLPGALDGSPNERLMPPVHAIELADRYDAPRQRTGQRFEAVYDTHDGEPPSVNRTLRARPETLAQQPLQDFTRRAFRQVCL